MKAKSLHFSELLFFTGIILFFSFSCAHLHPYLNTDFLKESLAGYSPQSVVLTNFTLYKQPDKLSCGATTASMVITYLSHSMTPGEFIEKYDSRVNTTDDMVRYLEKEMPDYRVDFKKDLSETEIAENIHSQLKSGIPVPLLFGAANPYNPPYYDFHFSPVTGIDCNAGTVTVANAYGYVEVISFTDLFNRMAYKELEKYPIGLQFGIVYKTQPSYALFVISKK